MNKLKNLQNLGQNPAQVTLAPGEFNNKLSTNIPREEDPFDFTIGTVASTSSVSLSDGLPVYFETENQKGKSFLIQIKQNPAEGSIPQHTSFVFKPGHIFKLDSALFTSSSITTIVEFGWFKKSDVIPTFNSGNVLGKKGEDIIITLGALTASLQVRAKCFIDTTKEISETEYVLAIITGSGSRPLTYSNYTVEVVPSRSGPLN